MRADTLQDERRSLRSIEEKSNAGGKLTSILSPLPFSLCPNKNKKSNLTAILVGLMMLSGGLASCKSLDIQNNVSSFPATESAETALVDPSSVAELERAIYQQVNQYRQSRKLPPLKLNSYVSQYARIHSEQMASGTVAFSHDGFDERIKAIGETISYQQAAENIAVNKGYQDPAKVAVDGWIESSGHRKNMEGKFDVTGIGIAKNADGEYYFTQIFLKEPSTTASNLPVKLPQSPLPKSTTSPLDGDGTFLITIEQKVHQQINRYRLSRNLPPLRLDAQLSHEARLYSQQMAQGKATFSHKGIEKRFKKVEQIIPYRKAAENLALNKGYQDPGMVAVEGWLKSPGHRKNIEGQFNLTGIGVAKNLKGEYYLTQFFILEK
ncbi:MAG: CAP domain-containing protein [Hydrococcus sp. Prado102]|nr:CAP domain-containing protein [Hydrococcus sp. Prado102]